jgi:hypothetical protein
MGSDEQRPEKLVSLLINLFESKARGKFAFDLAFNTVTNLLRAQALERLLINSGVIDAKQLDQYVNKVVGEFPENFKRIFAELASMAEE